MRLLGIVASSILKKISDTFTRTTSGSLGTSDSGNVWSAITGVWFANGTKAQSDTAVSSTAVALAGISVSPNVKASASVTTGTGVAFWVTDANSWWASTSYTTLTNCSTCYQTCYCSDCLSCFDTYSCNCSTCCAYYSCTDAGYSNTIRRGTSCFNVSTDAYQGPAACVGPYDCNCATCAGPIYACGGNYSCNPYSCNCTTNYYLQLLKSASGTISEATTKVSLTSAAAAIYVETAGDLITCKAYSDTALTTQLGSTLSYTPSSPTKGSIVGIIKVSSDNQNNLIDDFKAEA